MKLRLLKLNPLYFDKDESGVMVADVTLPCTYKENYGIELYDRTVEKVVYVGDFDSTEKPDEDCIVYPTEKDFTDSFIAAKYAYDSGYRTIHMYGCIGGKRLDHTVANIAMLEYFAKLQCDITLHAENQSVKAFYSEQNETSVFFDNYKKGYVSPHPSEVAQNRYLLSDNM